MENLTTTDCRDEMEMILWTEAATMISCMADQVMIILLVLTEMSGYLEDLELIILMVDMVAIIVLIFNLE